MKLHLLPLLAVLLLIILALPLQASIQAGDYGAELEGEVFWLVSGKSESPDGRYQLTGVNGQDVGFLSGGGYILTSPDTSLDSSAGCCCTYLPCFFMNE